MIEYYNIEQMLCFYFEQKNWINFNVGHIIRKNEFTFREDNIWSVKSGIDREYTIYALKS